MPPEWISSYGEFLEFVFTAHGEAVNASTVGTGGQGVHVAIIDSMQEYPYDLPSGVEVGDRTSFVGSTEDVTNAHGFWVFDTAAHFAPNAKYSFYQVIDESGDMGILPFSRSITAAIEADVDIINLSAGENWDGPPEDNPYSREIERAVDAGIIVVAAAGNYNHDGERPEVFHPARREDVIATGGFVTTCPCSHTETHDTPERGPYYDEEQIEDPPHDSSAKEVYCGYDGCIEGKSCLRRQTIKPWPGNPSEEQRSIDVLAPVFTAVNETELTYGTSHAAPVVSGVLAETFGNLMAQGHEIPSRNTIIEAIRKSSVSLDEGDGRRLNAIRLYNSLEELSAQSGAGSLAD